MSYAVLNLSYAVLNLSYDVVNLLNLSIDDCTEEVLIGQVFIDAISHGGLRKPPELTYITSCGGISGMMKIP